MHLVIYKSDVPHCIQQALQLKEDAKDDKVERFSKISV